MSGSAWRREIGSLWSRLSGKPGIPPGVSQLLGTLEREEPSAIAVALSTGRPASVIEALDEVSLQLGVESATELRSRFEELRCFEEAAAMDLVADRLRDELPARRS